MTEIEIKEEKNLQKEILHRLSISRDIIPVPLSLLMTPLRSPGLILDLKWIWFRPGATVFLKVQVCPEELQVWCLCTVTGEPRLR